MHCYQQFSEQNEEYAEFVRYVLKTQRDFHRTLTGQQEYAHGKRLQREGKLAEAKEAYQNAIEVGYFTAYTDLGEIFQQEGDFDAAEQAHLRATDGQNVHSFSWYARGKFYARRSRFSDAESAYRIAIDEGDLNARCALGNLYRDKGDKRNEAIAIYKEVIERAERGARFNLGLLYEREGNFAQAKQWFQDAIQKEKDENAWQALGKYL
jgi:tetratricopeptide (TPR) repeat protein